MRHRLLEAGGLGDQPLQRRPRLGDLLAQLLDLALGREDAARFGLLAAGDHVMAAEDVAFERRHRKRHRRRNARCGLERSAISAPPITA